MSQASRFARWGYTLAVILITLALYIIALTSPFFPFDSFLDSPAGGLRILAIKDSAGAGGLRAGDLIVGLNQRSLSHCRYLFWSPIVGTQPGDTVPVTYLRGATLQHTDIVLSPPFSTDYPYLLVVILVSSLFIASGVFISISRHHHLGQPSFLLGLLGTLGGLIILATGGLSAFRAPGAFLYPLGLPVWSLLAIITHRRWPVDQRDSGVIRVLFALTLIVAPLVFLIQLVNNAEFMCLFGARFRWANFALLGVAFLGLINLLVPLFRGMLLTENPHQRAQVRMLLLAVLAGLGIPIFTSMLPEMLGLQSPILPGFVFGVSVVIPVAYAVVAYETALMKIHRYTAFILFAVFIVATWFGLSAVAIGIAFQLWDGTPAILVVSLFTLLPALLFTTVIRDFLWRFVDFILYGNSLHHRQALELATRDLIRELEGLPDLSRIEHSLVRSLPVSFKVDKAALWVLDRHSGQLILRDAYHASVQEEVEGLPEIFPPSWFEAVDFSRIGNVFVFHQLNTLGEVPWHAAVRLRAADKLLGVLLLGARANQRPFSDLEVETFNTIATWAGNSILTHQLSVANLEGQQRTAALILEHEETLRQRIAASLHDEGLTHLSHIKRQLSDADTPSTLIDRVQTVIDRIRILVQKEVIPFEPLSGLIEAFESYCIERQLEGSQVSTHYDASARADWRRVDQRVRKAVYYVAREAVENALKADPDAPVKVVFEINEGFYRVVVSDQGPGFDASQARLERNEHYGLSVMEARMQMVRGKLDIQSDIGVGTTVTLTGPTILPASEGSDHASPAR